jgi:hypothetical protein
MKISGGETACTGNIKGSKGNENWFFTVSEPRSPGKKDKRELSHSEAKTSEDNDFYKFNNCMMRKSENGTYSSSSNELSYQMSNKTDSPTSRNGILEEDDEEAFREEHSENIMKNNGWNGVDGFFTLQREMKESIHEGQEEVIHRN